MTQLDFFRSSDRYESEEDTFDISKVQLDLEPDTLQREIFLRNIHRINALPSDTYILHKNGAFHRDRKNYSEPIYPYLYDYSSNRQVAVMLTRSVYPSLNIPTRFTDRNTLSINFHRLVAMCFLPNDEPLAKICVDHIDGDKQNYTLSNLEWVTVSENQRRRTFNK